MNNALRTYMDIVDVNISKTTQAVLEFFTNRNLEISAADKRSLITLLQSTIKESSVNGWEVLNKELQSKPSPTTKKRKK